VKILHVIPSVSPARGGTSRAILDMVHALQAVGIDVEIATTNDDGVRSDSDLLFPSILTLNPSNSRICFFMVVYDLATPKYY
jgi:hypothetical protein